VRSTARERAALTYADAVVRRDAEVSEVCFAQLREHFGDAEIVEVTAIVGYQCFASAFAKGLGVVPQGLAALSWASMRIPSTCRSAIVVLTACALASMPGGVSKASGEVASPGSTAPEVTAGAWINSPPLTLAALRGKVVLVDFWTYG
jgi:hypothetical protein